MTLISSDLKLVKYKINALRQKFFRRKRYKDQQYTDISFPLSCDFTYVLKYDFIISVNGSA